jgi:hypothetical protein
MMLLRALGVNRVHLGKLTLEGHGGENAAGDCLVVAKDHNAEA